MALRFVIFAVAVGAALAWPYDRMYDQPSGYQRPYGGYGRPNYGFDNSEYSNHQGSYARPQGGYGRPNGYGRPSNVDFGNNDNWQRPSNSGWQEQGNKWAPQPHQGQFPQQPNQGGQFEHPQPNPTTFGDRFGGPTTGSNFPTQVDPTNKVAEGVKTVGDTATPPANAPLDPNLDLTGSRVFQNNGGADAAAVTETTPQEPSNNGGDSTGLAVEPNGQNPSEQDGRDESIPTPPSSGSLFGGAQPGQGSEAVESAPTSANNEPPPTINPEATADGGLVLG